MVGHGLIKKRIELIIKDTNKLILFPLMKIPGWYHSYFIGLYPLNFYSFNSIFLPNAVLYSNKWMQ